MPRNNRILAPGARQALDQMKAEIAQEFGVQLGPDTTSRANGSVGGNYEAPGRFGRTTNEWTSSCGGSSINNYGSFFPQPPVIGGCLFVRMNQAVFDITLQ